MGFLIIGVAVGVASAAGCLALTGSVWLTIAAYSIGGSLGTLATASAAHLARIMRHRRSGGAEEPRAYAAE